MHLRHDEIRQKYGRHFVFKKKKNNQAKYENRFLFYYVFYLIIDLKAAYYHIN